jgi:hypothetical protein
MINKNKDTGWLRNTKLLTLCGAASIILTAMKRDFDEILTNKVV